MDDCWQVLGELQSKTRVDEKEALALRQLLEDVGRKRASGISDAERHLIRGYAAYHFEGILPEINAELELKSAIQLDPENSTARLYLAHHYFDHGNFQDALYHFDRIRTDQYVSCHQKWRVAKIEELILCCQIELNHFDAIVEQIALLLQTYRSIAVSEAPVPFEIVSLFVKNKEKIRLELGQEGFRKCVHELVSLVRDLDYEDCMSQQLQELELSCLP